jgi:hypothetical protein
MGASEIRTDPIASKPYKALWQNTIMVYNDLYA